MMKSALLLVGLVGIAACARPPVAATTAPAPPLAVSTEPLAHFQLKLLIAQSIQKADAQVGRPMVPLKTYPPVVAAKADFYLPAGASPESLAALSDGRTLLLHFSELAFIPDRATARQFLISGNFGTKITLGQGHGAAESAHAFCNVVKSSAPDPTFLINKSEPVRMMFDEFTQGGVSVDAEYQYELTYLGTTSERDLVNAPAPATLDLSNDPMQRQIEADAAALRGQGAAQ
ncbi:MAG TPA: hypothetical protein VHQ47_19610 [Phycisphaerae bacterium]|nr:hypothetical protein [Phycisphaerae bacterium]